MHNDIITSHHPTKCFGFDNRHVTNVNCNGNSNGAISINIAGGTTPYTYAWSNGATTQNITNLAPNTYTLTVTDANGCTATISQAITQPNALALTIGTVTNVNCNGNNNGAINNKYCRWYNSLYLFMEQWSTPKM
ncbi:MAG: SprB repeat-containing protein [Bacteroidetes bacterium]|nr:SprB repeat-containing protein [Bacteroidota bacterium]